MAYSYGAKEACYSGRVETVSPDMCPPCAESTFVDSVWECLNELDGSISRLERIKYNLCPICSDVNGECSKQPDITFEYVWGTLPDRLEVFSNRLFSFCDFVKEIVYKNPTKALSVEDKKQLDHVHTVSNIISKLRNSLVELEYLPDLLRGNVGAINQLTNDKEVMAFSSIWRDLPQLFNECSARVRKTEEELSALFLQKEPKMAQEKHR